MPLENWFEKADENFSDGIQEEYLLSHSLDKNTVECRAFVEILDPRGNLWVGERIIKIRLKRK